MRLWHEKMLPYLSKQHLQGQHRECCALRGLGWGRKHATVDYVFTYSPMLLAYYHCRLMQRLQLGWNVDLEPAWYDPLYRGLRAQPWPESCLDIKEPEGLLYPEHNAAYWQECRENLKRKGFDVSLIPEEMK